MIATKIFHKKEDLRKYLSERRKLGYRIGFVPTMGALHQGHGHLMTQSLQAGYETVVSIFVNPLQFGPQEDLAKYPRQFQSDVDLCQSLGVSAIFAPTVEGMYGENFCSEVSVSRISEVLCGKFRPHHFAGVATVVSILLNLIQPEELFLGQKDFQQVQIIKRMCSDLCIPTKITMVPTVREVDGLALSSRNSYLTPAMRAIAKTIPKALYACLECFQAGERDCQLILNRAQRILSEVGLEPQYLELRSMDNLAKELTGALQEPAVLAIALILTEGKTSVRLIDNLIMSEQQEHIQFQFKL